MSADVEAVLRRAQGQMTGVSGLQVAATDGRTTADTLDPDAVNSTAAVSASSLQLGRRLADLLGDGSLEQLTVRSTDGYVILYAIDSLWVLTVLTVPSANLARIHLTCRDLRDEVGSLLRAAEAALV